MDNDTSKKKELVINGTLYAHYLIDKAGPDECMWLKVRRDIIPENPEKSQTYLIELIFLIEGRRIPFVSYLNIE